MLVKILNVFFDFSRLTGKRHNAIKFPIVNVLQNFSFSQNVTHDDKFITSAIVILNNVGQIFMRHKVSAVDQWDLDDAGDLTVDNSFLQKIIVCKITVFVNFGKKVRLQMIGTI